MRRSDRIKEDFTEEDYARALHAAKNLAEHRRDFYLRSWPVLLDLIGEEMATHDCGFREGLDYLMTEFQIHDHNAKMVDIGQQILGEIPVREKGE